MSRKSRTSPLADQIANWLRERILTMNLRPGVRLNVDELRMKFDSSHIPIREALQRLEAEGLVTRLPNKSTHVALLNTPDALDLIDLRLMIEPMVAARALERQKPSDVAVARRALARLQKLDKEGAVPEFAEAHQQFHRSLLQPGLTPVYERYLTAIWQGLNRHTRYFYTFPHFSMAGSEQHEEMLELWAAKDPAFLDALTSHIESAREVIALICSEELEAQNPGEAFGGEKEPAQAPAIA